MSGGKRVLVWMAAVGSLLVVSWGLVAGVVYAWGGMMSVSVESAEEGLDLHLPVPMVLVNAAVATGRTMMPEEEMEEFLDVHAHLGEWQPLVRSLLRELDECPDVTLVEVSDGADRVLVEKEGRKLRVEVAEPGFALRFAVPTRSVRRVFDQLAI